MEEGDEALEGGGTAGEGMILTETWECTNWKGRKEIRSLAARWVGNCVLVLCISDYRRQASHGWKSCGSRVVGFGGVSIDQKAFFM